MTRAVPMIVLMVVVGCGCACTKSPVDAVCAAVGDNEDAANRLWARSDFAAASEAYERAANDREHCFAERQLDGPRAHWSRATDLLHAGETAHQAGDDRRALRFVHMAEPYIDALRGARDPSDPELDVEFEIAFKEVRSDLKGVWTEQGRLR